jgi:hypothetical protein
MYLSAYQNCNFLRWLTIFSNVPDSTFPVKNIDRNSGINLNLGNIEMHIFSSRQPQYVRPQL